MKNYFLILYRKGKFGAYKFCYNAGTDIFQVRNYWAINEKKYKILNIKQIPNDKVEKFKKFIKNKKGLNFHYTMENGNKFLSEFGCNFWS